MALIESCIFYEDSRCTLKGGCCDLDCNLTKNDMVSHRHGEMDPFTEWETPKKQDKEGLEWKSK
jgi:hypothetical protein